MTIYHKNTDEELWEIGREHKAYGKVAGMRTVEGEPYRFFVKDGSVSMIPLSVLQQKKPRLVK